jgi:hypothetical protein
MDCPVDELETFGEATLRELISSGVAMQPMVVGVPDGGFALVFANASSGSEIRKVLATSRGPVRRFGSLDSAGSFLRELAVDQFLVDLADYRPGRVRGPRPDRAEALRRTRTSPKQAELLLQGVEE